MAYDRRQFGNLVERVLMEIRMFSVSAARLLLGTAAQESHFGTYLRQVNGPALGAFQMEPKTFEWLQHKYEKRIPEITGKRFEELEWNLRLSIIFARLLYNTKPEPLPEPDDLEGLARYWKTHYNTELGKGTTDEFMRNYARFVLNGKE